MRSKFDQQLAALNQELTEMGATCAQAIGLAAQALEQQDVALAAPVGQLEEQTNEQERTIEALCLKLLLQQQPVARDLRQISAALKMITDMERIGDQAADIAEIIPFFLSHNTFDCTLVCRMAQQASSMVTQSVDAFVRPTCIWPAPSPGRTIWSTRTSPPSSRRSSPPSPASPGRVRSRWIF